MPAVVDAFKNLIRKHHHHRHPDSDPQPYTAPVPESNHQAQHRQQQQESQQQAKLRAEQESQKHQQPEKQHQLEKQQQQPEKQQQQPENIPQPEPVPDTRHQKINTPVPEDREPKNKLPTYKGLENFKLLDKMGDGAFSNVYKAIDLTTGQTVAVKVVRKFELNASQAGEKHLNIQFKKKPRVTERANILKEVQIMRGTNHPSIVKLISFSESQEHYFLVMELMEGGELFHQIVKLTYFSENLARHVILQVAQGIRYLHEERGVVHRDIKPENLLFERIPIIPSKGSVQRPYDEEKEDEGEFVPGVGGGGIGRIKIADFGLSKVIWNEETMTPCGTVGYTAPEIVKDERYSQSVDMWALGCVLYTLLCGFPPFYDESINVLTEKVARGYYTFLSPWWDDITHSAKDLIQHLLCVDPAQRYTIDEFLAHPWCTAAPAPPPVSSTPVYVNSPPLDSPLLTAARGGVLEARSPGLATLKEAFDITYAVHRMEEEGARRRAYNGRGGAGIRGYLHGLNENEEDNVDDKVLVHDARNRRGELEMRTPIPLTLSGLPGAGAKTVAKRNVIGGPNQADRSLLDGRAGPRDRGRRQPGGQGFQLDMDNATLLGRRNRKMTGPGIAESSPLSHAVHIDDYSFPPGSPMRVV
ncbi:kinase-like domain-containing protein [Suillus plorans]|uniref:Kinase-like domain-containing protein n=1 Tax=Suillus plorans TaxID=116603 RepID=A0A9P7AKG0_9AGAM|nr:kinase-like domain-containing protein [Suillus plorans]KAG1791346.1 kinase-like domain-containing protein [Suillus plorans]